MIGTKDKVLFGGAVTGIVYACFCLLAVTISLAAYEETGTFNTIFAALWIISSLIVLTLSCIICGKNYRRSKPLASTLMGIVGLVLFLAIMYFSLFPYDDYHMVTPVIVFVVLSMIIGLAIVITLGYGLSIVDADISDKQEDSQANSRNGFQAWQIVLAVLFFPIGLLFLLVNTQNTPQILIQNNTQIETLKKLKEDGDITEQEYKKLLMKELEK